MIEDLEQRIRERAHAIWEREGRPSDRAEAHWGMAIAEVSAEAAPGGAGAQSARRKVAAAATPAAPKRRSAVAKTKPTE
ncbi:MAG: DUF2934 domain-containing protein [Rhodobacteraceae bacterium]|nr:DUF2934 domain-containing protein [Paracoccaceae bacterium]